MSRSLAMQETPDSPTPAHQDRARVPVRLVALAASLAVTGAPLGLLWSWLAPAVPVRVTADGVAFAEQHPQQVAAADGWFTLLGLGLGVLAAAAVWRWAPRLRGVAGVLGLTAGLVAAGLLAWYVGRQVGLASYEAALAAAEPGSLLQRPPDLRVISTGWWPPLVTGVPLVAALAGAVTYALLAAWSRYPTLHPTSPGAPPLAPPSNVGDIAGSDTR